MRKLTALPVVLLLVGLVLCFSQNTAVAASAAQQSLETTVNQVLGELKKPEFTNPASRKTVLNKVEQIILTLFSFDELSQRTVGPKWNNFSSSEKSAFKDAFQDLLRERYVGALEGYSGETVSYLRETPVGSGGDKVQIDSQVMVKGKAVPMNYRMMKKGKWVVYDIIIEGVSLVQNYRSQFQSVLQRGNAQQLIDLVRQKADETRASKK